MSELIAWLNKNKNEISVPILATIAHYQYAAIHPYYDGNGRTARILTTVILHLHGYDLKGIYNPEEYYAKNLQDYYSAIDIGKSHNYYLGRADADIISRIEYFITGMLESLSKAEKHLEREKGRKDQSDNKLHIFDTRQKKVLTLFEKNDYITSKDLEKPF